MDNVGFTGHQMDGVTGLIYMQQRYYDPYTAQFLSVDPAYADLNSGSNFNRRNYANNKPFKFIDPDGRQNYGYGTNQPDRIEDCHQTRTCKSLDFADDVVKKDAEILGAWASLPALFVGGEFALFSSGTARAAKATWELIKQRTTQRILCYAIDLACANSHEKSPIGKDVPKKLDDDAHTTLQEGVKKTMDDILKYATKPERTNPRPPPQKPELPVLPNPSPKPLPKSK